MADNSNKMRLPENAYRELKPGEKYVPVISKEKGFLEVTVRSVLFGLVMTLLFSGAASYIALKLGQGIESAIPISILAVGFSAMLARKSTLLENINILAVGATSGIVAGGSVFVMPAIFVLDLDTNFFQIFLVPLLGAILGVLFLIPFRRYFVSDQHGKLPFPEGTAITEVLVVGEKGGKQAKILAYAIGIGAVYDFLSISMRAWAESFSTSMISLFDFFTLKVKLVFSLNTSAAIMGLGYLIGVRYASIILAGSVMSFFVLTPLFAYLGSFLPAGTIIPPGPSPIAEMPAEDVFYHYARYVGIGGIFAAGVISILKMSKVIVSAFSQALKEVFRKRDRDESAGQSRVDRDIPMSLVIGMIIAVTLLIWVYFRFVVLSGMEGATGLSIVSILLTLVIAFLFISVSAWAVAMISVTPISGMTLMTLIVSAVLLSQLGMSGKEGMLATILIGGVVCTALSMAGSLVTQFKIGYWLGSTPKSIEWSNIWGCVAASITVTAVIILLAHVYGYSPSPAHPNPLPAPQANAMAAVIDGLMGGGQAPWFLYGLGVIFAIIVEMLGVSALAFALGMYLPIELNSPIMAGAIVAWLVKKSSKKEKLAKSRHEKGILIASGLIAGGAIIGVVGALFKFFEDKFQMTLVPDLKNIGQAGNWLGLIVFILLGIYIYWDATRAKAEE